MKVDRFKFRFFQKEQCKMFYCDYLSFQSIEEYHSGNVVIMQCTGLKDKNGKLIYEGDIVRCDYDLSVNHKVVFYRNAFCLETSWRYEDGKLRPQEGQAHFNWLHFCKTDHSDYVVDIIGNIYENKELLEVKN